MLSTPTTGQKYQLLVDNVEDLSVQNELNDNKRENTWLSRRWAPTTATFCFLTLLASSLLGFYLGRLSGPRENACIDSPWNELKDSLEFETKTFDGHFEVNSPYQGSPNEDLDQRWSNISKLWNFGVDKETLERANKTKGLVQWPGTDKYMVSMHSFHEFHCLNYIRMYTYMDHYETFDDDMSHETLDQRRDHKDHCVEMLRQRLMCNPDMNIYSFHWVSWHDKPYTQLKTEHRCINWDKFFEWTVPRRVASPPLRKPEGAEVLA